MPNTQQIKHLINAKGLTPEYVNKLINIADKIIKNPDDFSNCCNRKKLASLFFEPSTRTRLSFEAAMLDLGGNVIGFSSSDSSSATKGESVADTIRVIAGYADIAVIRHPKEGAALVAANHSKIPVINAGDGGHEHPTQTLTDLLTIKETKGTLSNLTIGLCGDLKFGRTVHSLIKALYQYPNNKFILVSPNELKIPDYMIEKLHNYNVSFIETTDLSEHLPELDILYMTRVQGERFFNEEDYIRLKDSYIINKEKLETSKKDLAILHPLPRVNEISTELDNDPRAFYFQQAIYGKFIRMALILDLLDLYKN